MLVYLDNSATTKQSAEVTEAMLDIMNNEFGNPSSLHSLGFHAEKRVKAAREAAAAVIGASSDEVYFTSGGTESDNTAIFGAWRMLKRQGNHVITTEMEHPAVLECFKRMAQDGAEVTYLRVDSTGHISLDELKSAIRPETILVSVMHVNNETGAIQPIGQVGQLVHQLAPKALFHCDAVQSYGKLPINVREMNIDLLAASGHKIHGPKGTGILYVRNGIHLPAYMCGGGQEKGFRSGTENVPGIVGFGKAAELAAAGLRTNLKKLEDLRSDFSAKISDRIDNIKINGEGDVLPYVLNISFRGVRGEVILHTLETAGVYVSTGSACSSHKKGGSHVLTSMKLKPEEIEGAIRFSFSPYTSPEELDFALEEVVKAVESNRKMLALAGRFKR